MVSATQEEIRYCELLADGGASLLEKEIVRLALKHTEEQGPRAVGELTSTYGLLDRACLDLRRLKMDRGPRR